MTICTSGNVIQFLRGSRRAPPTLDQGFESTVSRVAAIPTAELLDEAHHALNLARFTPGTVTSYDRAVHALLCLTRLADEWRPSGRAGA